MQPITQPPPSWDRPAPLSSGFYQRLSRVPESQIVELAMRLHPQPPRAGPRNRVEALKILQHAEDYGGWTLTIRDGRVTAT